ATMTTRSRRFAQSFANAPLRLATTGAWPGAWRAVRRLRRGVSPRKPSAFSRCRVAVLLAFRYLMVRRRLGRFRSRKNTARNALQPVEAFAQARTYRAGIQRKGFADLFVTQVAEISQLNNLSAGFAELFERDLQQGRLFVIHQCHVRPRRGRRRI